MLNSSPSLPIQAYVYIFAGVFWHLHLRIDWLNYHLPRHSLHVLSLLILLLLLYLFFPYMCGSFDVVMGHLDIESVYLTSPGRTYRFIFNFPNMFLESVLDLFYWLLFFRFGNVWVLFLYFFSLVSRLFSFCNKTIRVLHGVVPKDLHNNVGEIVNGD